MGQQAGAVLKSGTWFSYKGADDGEIRLGQGRERARQFLVDNPDLADELHRTIMDKMAPKPDPDPATPGDAGAQGTVEPAPAARAAAGKQAGRAPAAEKAAQGAADKNAAKPAKAPAGRR